MKNILLIIICLIYFSFSSNSKEKKQEVQNTDQVSTFRGDSNQNNNEFVKTSSQAVTETENSNSSFVNHFLIVLISVFFSIFIMLIYNNITFRSKIIKTTLESNRVKDFIKSFLPQINGSTNSAKTNSIGHQNSLNSRDVDLLVQKVIEIIKRENPGFFDKKEDASKVIPIIMPVNEILEVPKKRTKFYSVEPRDGVSFNGSGFSDEFIATESVYFIELQNDNLAHFSIVVDNDTMGRAIKYKKELIDIACESLVSSIDTKRIVTEKPGIAQKDGNKWVIKQKAQIKFV